MKQKGEKGEKDESLNEKERQKEVERERNELYFVGSPNTPRLHVRKLLAA